LSHKHNTIIFLIFASDSGAAAPSSPARTHMLGIKTTCAISLYGDKATAFTSRNVCIGLTG